MICVILGRGRHSALLEEWEQAAQAGAELVELRIDCLRKAPDLERILAKRHTPVVFTVRKGADGGLYRGDEDARLSMIRKAIVAGVDYVDLEMDTAQAIKRPKFAKTKRIVSYHNFQKMPEDLEYLAEKMRALDPDIVKIATVAHSVKEASRLLEFVREANKVCPTIGIAMGDLGSFTRILGTKYGAPYTYAGFNPERMFAPGLLLYQQLKREFFHDQIDHKTELYGVIGDPIGHSLSPIIHNTAFRHEGLNKVLVPFRIPADRLEESLNSLRWLGLKGISVTIPHKETVIPMLKTVDHTVETVKACNTMVHEHEGWVGHNTDITAAMECLEAVLKKVTPEVENPLMDKQVLILGAGGVARAIAAGLMQRGAGVALTARKDEKATKLAEELNCRSVPWTGRASTIIDILINCTPVGMHPEVDDSPVPVAAFRPGLIVFDTIYRPENTLFIKQALDRECMAITGVHMFVRQAALQYQYYTGHQAPEQLMYETVKRKLSAAQD